MFTIYTACYHHNGAISHAGRMEDDFNSVEDANNVLLGEDLLQNDYVKKGYPPVYYISNIDGMDVILGVAPTNKVQEILDNINKDKMTIPQ